MVGISVPPIGHRGAAAGMDHGRIPTAVAFAPGETATSFDVSIFQDDFTEPRETIGLQLTEPRGGRLGAQQVAAVRIASSDVRPDLVVRRTSDMTRLGENIYADTAAGQTRRWRSRAGGTRAFVVEVCNDPRQRQRDDFRSRLVLHAEATGSRSRTRWFSGRREITDNITSPSALSVRIVAGRCLPIHVTTRIRPGAAVGSRHPTTVQAEWTGENPAVDVAGTEVRVVD